ncbi:GOLPH3/VPS74 family protein [Pilimelia columellifera]|uniref:Golgi phosphoprotein 3 n=1 Tax=Pilimelia columellifera subsp. columellifera TaxID=706583 RepID=A0ABN3NKI2_9ACTN
MTSVALAEELLLLAYDDETGKATGSRIGLDLGMAAAVLVELALAGRVALDGTLLTVPDPTPTGEPIADGVLAVLARDTPQSAGAWVQRLRHGLRDKVLADLCARGIIRDVDEKALEHIPLHRYPLADGGVVEQEVRSRLAAALTADDAPAERTAALAALVAATRMEPALRLASAETVAAHRRLEEIAERAGFASGAGMENSVVRPSVALVIGSLCRAIDTALGRAAA